MKIQVVMQRHMGETKLFGVFATVDRAQDRIAEAKIDDETEKKFRVFEIIETEIQ